MPIYSYKCPTCGHTQDLLCSVADRDRRTPTCCKNFMEREVSHPQLVRSDPTGWSDENGGRGRYITQLQKTLGSRKDPDTYCTSRQQAIDKAHRRGDRVEIVA